MKQLKKQFSKKRFCAVCGVLLFVLFAFFLRPPAALAAAAEGAGSTGDCAMRILGITLLSISWWVGDVIADWLTTIVMMLLWVMAGNVPFTKAFSAFSGTSVWLIVGAFCLAASITKTGFFKRISWFLLQIAPPTFAGQVAALLLVGSVCAPLVPSATAKAVLGASIAYSISASMGYSAESKGRYGLFLASWVGFGATAPAFMSGSVFGYTLLGALSDSVRAELTWIKWLIVMIPWLLILLIGSFLVIQFFFQPKEATTMTKEYAREEYRKLGLMDRKEKLSAVFLALAVFLWVFEAALGINAAVTALLAAFLCFASGILDRKEIASAVPWGLVIFLGGVLSLGSVFSGVGINVWLEKLLAPFFAGCGSYMMLPLVALLVILVRFVIVSQSATIIIMMAILTPVAQALGIHAFIIGIVVYTAEQCWFMSYQNVVFAPALACMNGTITHGKTTKVCVAYELISLGACLLSIPYWKLLGYM